jgi:putative FmdB family regulatory protein
MPLYEYQCERGHRFERIVKFSDPPIDVCPECGAAAHKLMSSPAIQFKGSGWYITDYARAGKDGKDAKSTKDSGEGKDAKDAQEKKEGTESKETKETKETKTEKPAASDSSASAKSSTDSKAT